MPTLITLYDLDGTTVRLHVDKAHGYALTSWSDSWQWVRETVASRKMDGEAEVNRRRGPATIQASFIVRGADIPHVDGLVAALQDAMSTPFLLARSANSVTKTWRCRAADVNAAFNKEDPALAWRTVAVSIPASPNITMTGLVMP